MVNSRLVQLSRGWKLVIDSHEESKAVLRRRGHVIMHVEIDAKTACGAVYE